MQLEFSSLPYCYHHWMGKPTPPAEAHILFVTRDAAAQSYACEFVRDQLSVSTDTIFGSTLSSSLTHNFAC